MTSFNTKHLRRLIRDFQIERKGWLQSQFGVSKNSFFAILHHSLSLIAILGNSSISTRYLVSRPLYSAKDQTDTQTGNFIVSDFAIVYDFTVNNITRQPACLDNGSNLWVASDDPTCDKASTYNTVVDFAAVNIIRLYKL